MREWFDRSAASAAFVRAAGEGVQVISIEVHLPEVRQLRAVYSFDGLPGRRFFVDGRCAGTSTHVAGLLGRMAALSLERLIREQA